MSCLIQEITKIAKTTDAILEITAQDVFAVQKETDSASSLRLGLLQRILHHIQEHPKGSVILVQRIEDIAPDLFIWLVRTLSSWRRTASSSKASPSILLLEQNQNEFRSADISNTVFIFTSATAGLGSIKRKMRQLNQLPAYDASFLADLTHEIDQEYYDNATPTSFDSREIFDAIVPFGPLTKEHLMTILRLRISQMQQQYRTKANWKDLVVTEAAIQTILDPSRVEYLQRVNRPSAEGSAGSSSSSSDGSPPPTPTALFSMYGARVLDDQKSPLWKLLQSQVFECFVIMNDDSNHKQDRPVAVIDVDISWRANNNVLVLKWCNDDMDSTYGDSKSCHEVCRFAIG